MQKKHHNKLYIIAIHEPVNHLTTDRVVQQAMVIFMIPVTTALWLQFMQGKF